MADFIASQSPLTETRDFPVETEDLGISQINPFPQQQSPHFNVQYHSILTLILFSLIMTIMDYLLPQIKSNSLFSQMTPSQLVNLVKQRLLNLLPQKIPHRQMQTRNLS